VLNYYTKILQKIQRTFLVVMVIMLIIIIILVMIIMMSKIIDHLVQEGVDVIISVIKVELLYHQQRRQQHQEIITNPIVVPFYFFSISIKTNCFLRVDYYLVAVAVSIIYCLCRFSLYVEVSSINSFKNLLLI